MFFMTRKRFEEEVTKRIEEWQRREDRERELRHMYDKIFRLEERMTRLECKGKMDGVPMEVCNAKEF